MHKYPKTAYDLLFVGQNANIIYLAPISHKAIGKGIKYWRKMPYMVYFYHPKDTTMYMLQYSKDFFLYGDVCNT